MGPSTSCRNLFFTSTDCFCCPLHDFCWFREEGYSTVTILILTILERASNESFLSQFHTAVLLYRHFVSNEFFGQYREPRASENRVILSFSVVPFAVCDSSFQLQDTVLAVSDLRQRVIDRDQSDRSLAISVTLLHLFAIYW